MAHLLLLHGHLYGVMYRCVPVIARTASSLRMLRRACLTAVVQFLMVASVWCRCGSSLFSAVQLFCADFK